jgi:phenylacetate-CoA ligase
MFKNKYFHMLRLLQNERRPLAELRRTQNQKLRRLIHHAYHHVPFYRERFKKINLHPEDIQTIYDLNKIPIIDKNDILKNDLSDFMDNRIKNFGKLFPISTSGSSGQILQFFVDRQYNQFRKAQFLRPYLTNGNGLRPRLIWFRGRPESKQRLHQKLGFLKDYQMYSGLDPNRQIEAIQKIKPTVMRGYGSTFQLLASKILEEQIPIPSPQVIFTDSELLSLASRRKIETAFQSEIIDIYGTFETDNIAYECRKHEGYHIAIDCVIMEFLKGGRSVTPGEEGEIVCTVLDNHTFPFIRYNLHDFATCLDHPCSCGRTFPLMETIVGRTHSYAEKKDGTKISSTTLNSHMWHLGKFIHEFKIIQKTIDLFLVLIVPSKLYSEEIEKEIQKGLLRDFPYATIHIHRVDHIEREKSGKLLDFKKFC